MSSSNPTSVEEGKETANSDPVEVSNDRSSAEKKKGKKRARDQTQVATEAKGEVDGQSVDEPEATEGTASSAPPPSKRWTKSAIIYLQAENEKLRNALEAAQRILFGGGEWWWHSRSQRPRLRSRRVRQQVHLLGRSISTPSTGVLGISNDRMVNIHLNSNRRGSLDSATFTSEQRSIHQ